MQILEHSPARGGHAIGATRQPVAAHIAAPIAGWAPATVVAQASARRSGIIGGVWDAVRGVSEQGAGQTLTDAQIATLAPFLADAWQVSPGVVLGDLARTRIYTGGPAGDRGGWAVTVGTDIYVARAADVTRITSWEGRRWLAHELGHTMQWRRSPGDTDLARTRRFMGTYVGALLLDDRHRPGALARGAWEWLHGKLDDRPGGPTLDDAIHDSHHMEIAAERAAQAFLKLTS